MLLKREKCEPADMRAFEKNRGMQLSVSRWICLSQELPVLYLTPTLIVSVIFLRLPRRIFKNGID